LYCKNTDLLSLLITDELNRKKDERNASLT